MLAGKADSKVILPEGQKYRKQSRDELGKLAGVSGSTYEHATKVMDETSIPIVNATRNNEISINAAYQTTKLPKTQQTEIAERIKQGEPAKSAISEVKSRNRKSEHDTTANTSDDVLSQSATSETSLCNNKAIPTAMNDEKQSQEVSTANHSCWKL